MVRLGVFGIVANGRFGAEEVVERAHRGDPGNGVASRKFWRRGTAILLGSRPRPALQLRQAIVYLWSCRRRDEVDVV